MKSEEMNMPWWIRWIIEVDEWWKRCGSRDNEKDKNPPINNGRAVIFDQTFGKHVYNMEDIISDESTFMELMSTDYIVHNKGDILCLLI